MKRIIYPIFALLMVFSVSDAQSQCNPEEHTNTCIPKLSTGFNFLKSYKVDGQGGNKDKVEYSYVFTKGTQYMINVCGPGGNTDGIVINLYDSQRNKVGTSLHDGQALAAFVYPCSTTGIYYIAYTFDGSTSYCGGSALGFKR
ncbi:MAG: hypothetical protein OEX02_01985 [Cyclobacteriaceae bacterium]|nr:hypothetical protein [Cyclobacteriaceae bacterium]